MKSKKESSTSSAARTSRRKFTKAVATTLIAAPLASRLAHAQQKPATTKEPAAPPNPPTPAAQQAQKPNPVADAYAEVARARFGDHLSPEGFEQVKKDLQSYVQTSERLRTVKLKNEDEPDFVFSTD